MPGAGGPVSRNRSISPGLQNRGSSPGNFKVAYWITSNIAIAILNSIAPPLVIALPTFDSKVVAVNPFALFFI